MVKTYQYAEVILGIKALDINHPFDYFIPHNLSGSLKIGTMVMVPFGSRLEVGYVVKLKNSTTVSQKQLKAINRVIEAEPIFDFPRIKLIYWMAFYYVQPLASVAALFTPPGKKIEIDKIWSAVTQGEELASTGLSFPLQDKELKSKPKLRKMLLDLEKKGLLRLDYVLSKSPAGFKYQQMVGLDKKKLAAYEQSASCHRNKAQARIIGYLKQKGRVSKSELIQNSKAGYSSLKSLQQKGIVEIVPERVKRDFKYFTPPGLKPNHILNNYQKESLRNISEAIDKKQYRAFLLQGVAGSGKTRVYLEACKKVLGQGRQVLIMTPEISLTPQLFSRFNQELGEKVSVYHSNMSPAERYERWMEAAQEQIEVVIGTRSALFLPLRNLGLIVVDEEHDPSYKENSQVRYNVQDVALKLAKILKIPIVFGSATPSVSMRYRAERDNEFKLLIIPVKAATDQKVIKEVVDLKSMEPGSQSRIISNTLHKSAKEELNKGNKVIIFLNKRGYSNFLICGSCGHVPKCPACNLSLKYHLADNLLKCHHCGREFDFSQHCSQCGQKNVMLKGTGIQKVETQLNLRFKPVQVIRMDSDATMGKKSHQQILNRFIKPGAAILLGTQMIAKGLDIEDVTLVGIINTDSMMELPDYHMNERVYQLISQVAGRAGRKDKPGKVIIQTYNPQHEVIKCFMEKPYHYFYQQELKNRKELDYPPFTHIINIVISGIDAFKVEEDCYAVFTELSKILTINNSLLGPSPAPFSKVNGYYRWHIMIKTKSFNQTLVGINKKMKQLKKDVENKIIIDVDPAWIL